MHFWKILKQECIKIKLIGSRHDTEEEEELHPSIRDSFVNAEGDYCSGCGHLLSGHPELAYHFGLTSCMLLVSLMVQRMQYLFTPYIVIFAATFYGNSVVYARLSRLVGESYSGFIDQFGTFRTSEGDKKFIVCQRMSIISTIFEWSRQAIVLAVTVKVSIEAFHNIGSQLSDLREFYDPDTVQLMHWIRSETIPQDSFAGSMQLMAAVKLITSRPIVNHPHYEDVHLRIKTQKLYQMYGRQTARHVWEILRHYHVNHIIVEDSICLATSNGCQLKDLVDIANGHMLENQFDSNFDLNYVNVPRFCDEIRFVDSNANSSFSDYFHARFTNPTFRVYRVL